MGYQKCSHGNQKKAQVNPEGNAKETKDNPSANPVAHGWCPWKYAG